MFNRLLSRASAVFRLMALIGFGLMASTIWSRDLEPEPSGELGGKLALLEMALHRPSRPGENNYYVDLISPGLLPRVARRLGLTNNHALMVDAHGRSVASKSGRRYGLFPAASWGTGEPVSASGYSARDLAEVLGPEGARGIHNLVIASCNEDGELRLETFRRWFPQATNIIHIPAGQAAFRPMLLQTLSRHSLDLQPLYAQLRPGEGKGLHEILTRAAPGAIPLGFFEAELYRPGCQQPFRKVRAGRELLQPGFRSGGGVSLSVLSRDFALTAVANRGEASSSRRRFGR